MLLLVRSHTLLLVLPESEFQSFESLVLLVVTNSSEPYDMLQVKNPYEGEIAKVIPTPNNGHSELVKLNHCLVCRNC